MLVWLRKGLLIYLLVLVAGGAWLARARTTAWDRSLWVVVHPINGDGSAVSTAYIDALPADAFAGIQTFMAEEAEHHGVALREPVRVVLGAPVAQQPPAPPLSRSLPAVVWWSLRLRWWHLRVERESPAPVEDVHVYVRYFDPRSHPRLAHSLGLREGLIGVVNAFADRRQAGSNRVIIAHELMHTLGAGDRYDAVTGLPVHPEGYAEPERVPLHPQRWAELMGGRIPLSPGQAEIPSSLSKVIVGPLTAAEIGWRAPAGAL